MPASARRRLIAALLTPRARRLARRRRACRARRAGRDRHLTRRLGPGTLDDAVSAVDDGGSIEFTAGPTGTITLSSPLFIGKAMTIEGPGAQVLAISGGDLSSLFAIDSAGDVEPPARRCATAARGLSGSSRAAARCRSSGPAR